MMRIEERDLRKIIASDADAVCQAPLSLVRRTLEDSRKTHLAWVKYYETHPGESDAHSQTAGSLEEQRRNIGIYEAALQALTSLPAKLREAITTDADAGGSIV